MRFVWFWSFWHWSREGFRDGLLLRRPLAGIGSHWDEWFRHEASPQELQKIGEAGRTEAGQRQFIAWLYRRWARESGWGGNRMVTPFVLGQLAHLPPFSQWPAFEKYRASYGAPGIPAIVLTAESKGEAEDVRRVEALALPAENEPGIVPERFQADAAELETPRRAALELLSGKGLLRFLALWIVGGERPHPPWLKIVLRAGWLAVSGLILCLLFAPAAGDHLFATSAALVGLWGLLLLTAGVVAGRECFRAWRRGRDWQAQLERAQLRLRMNGGLTLKGGSAGLAFCLNILLALHQANPLALRGSWLWQRSFRRLRAGAGSWAATGVVTADGKVLPVVLEPKLRACLQQSGINHLLTPNQPEARPRFVSRLAGASPPFVDQSVPDVPPTAHARLGFAAEQRRLINHPCRHVAQAIMVIGGFNNRWQKGVNCLALITSCTLLFALSDLRGILFPPAAPEVVAPSSPSPYHLWVSLDATQPDDFQVVLESSHWANRRAKVARHSGANASVRAEIVLHRLAGQPGEDGEEGTIWIERRRHFLGREYSPGERVGRYSISYLNRLAHE